MPEPVPEPVPIEPIRSIVNSDGNVVAEVLAVVVVLSRN